MSVYIKVSKVTHPTEVPTGKKKQDVIIVGGSGSAKCVLWEENIGNLKGKWVVSTEFLLLCESMAANICPWLRRDVK